MRGFIILLVLIPLGFGAGLYAASNLGGEVVTLVTRDADGREFETPLWIVEDDGSLWLRAGDPESRWLERLRGQPRVELVRDGERLPYRAFPEPDLSPRINRLMAEDYGWADSLLDLMRDPEQTTAIRLEPGR
jgi:hypothetical protein